MPRIPKLPDVSELGEHTDEQFTDDLATYIRRERLQNTLRDRFRAETEALFPPERPRRPRPPPVPDNSFVIMEEGPYPRTLRTIIPRAEQSRISARQHRAQSESSQVNEFSDPFHNRSPRERPTLGGPTNTEPEVWDNDTMVNEWGERVPHPSSVNRHHSRPSTNASPSMSDVFESERADRLPHPSYDDPFWGDPEADIDRMINDREAAQSPYRPAQANPPSRELLSRYRYRLRDIPDPYRAELFGDIPIPDIEVGRQISWDVHQRLPRFVRDGSPRSSLPRNSLLSRLPKVGIGGALGAIGGGLAGAKVYNWFKHRKDEKSDK